ncbi:class I SAM-dependent methyltransferase [Clostridium estertheticum]|uniref:Uncharacterized protein n=1 Tax=Clostridium estertheticum subsp. estertheticum TaxID=1552 RepID=A0A1J0GCE6_9CLOT|nr:class I SAM-dependent methyltransferase [Clostridium estertheticum]APC39017.1 hypothetical protein A7L45_02510 [Clostridium estertheticum subsp. estertheticum]MBU3173743.1 class I SAM-dependent methyltransferase [Clostridium estertheticum]
MVCLELELSKPELPIFRNIYNLYFNFALPIIGYLGTQDKAAYYYLRDSVNGFMPKVQLREEFEHIDFDNTEFKSLTLGIASLHYGIKPLYE